MQKHWRGISLRRAFQALHTASVQFSQLTALRTQLLRTQWAATQTVHECAALFAGIASTVHTHDVQHAARTHVNAALTADGDLRKQIFFLLQRTSLSIASRPSQKPAPDAPAAEGAERGTQTPVC